MGIKGWILEPAAAGTTGECGIARYFFHRTVVWGDAKCDRTQKMTGAGWGAYIPGIRASGEWLIGQSQEGVCIISWSGLRLRDTFFCCEGSGKAVVCLHGYTNEGSNDYASITKFYPSQGFSLMTVNERAHGKSESAYIGFGCLDCNDTKQWVEYTVERLGEDCELTLHSISMRATTVLMPTGPSLPKQVRAVMSDCALTSAWEVFSYASRSMYHMPVFPMTQIADRMIRSEAGYGPDECNTREEVKEACIPIPLIHGDRSTPVSCSMVYKLYKACALSKGLLVVSRASHAEAYYKEADHYKYAIGELTARFFGREENKVRR